METKPKHTWQDWRNQARTWYDNEYASDMSKKEMVESLAFLLQSAYRRGLVEGAKNDTED